ncbi:hypothetical protein HGM15179_007979 [Zosterops borbonicus]|uniref:Uncharacterized protein n=1 Tax=Zosterops borbonicus TaxID=364589 RepID=A0A8K1GHW3_9PASS|nr:hypothetical protein HGM15179_007979 [Zosterops borbonicus]
MSSVWLLEDFLDIDEYIRGMGTGFSLPYNLDKTARYDPADESQLSGAPSTAVLSQDQGHRGATKSVTPLTELLLVLPIPKGTPRELKRDFGQGHRMTGYLSVQHFTDHGQGKFGNPRTKHSLGTPGETKKSSRAAVVELQLASEYLITLEEKHFLGMEAGIGNKGECGLISAREVRQKAPPEDRLVKLSTVGMASLVSKWSLD